MKAIHIQKHNKITIDKYEKLCTNTLQQLNDGRDVVIVYFVARLAKFTSVEHVFS